MKKNWKIWLEFEAYDPSQKWDPDTECFNMSVQSDDGREWALNVWSYGSIDEARQEARELGEELNGRYLIPPDLLVEKADRKLMEEVVSDLIENDLLKDEWLVLKPPGEQRHV